jgi:hypothetical protein
MMAEAQTGRVNAVTRDGGAGLALLRLKPALSAAADLRVESASGARVTPQRPVWWPEQWGREEEDSVAPL